MRWLVVDGYNVLHATERYRSLTDEDLDSARARLVAEVAAYLGPDERAVVVFDGAGNPASDGSPHEIADVTVVFSAFGTDADTVVEHIVARHRAAGDQVVLVTSDQAMQWTAMGRSVVRMSSAEFARELGEESVDRGEHMRDGYGVTLDRRIDPETREQLARWARGTAPREDRS